MKQLQEVLKLFKEFINSAHLGEFIALNVPTISATVLSLLIAQCDTKSEHPPRVVEGPREP